MLVSLEWLREYVDVPPAPEEAAELLTMAGLEVDDVDLQRPAFDGVVVGHVISVRPHPNAGRLRVCEVDIGAVRRLQIVCGASNVESGQNVPVAMVGSKLQIPNRDDQDSTRTVIIQRAKLVGVESEGMICAGDELGLSDDHSGILVLGADALPGEPLGEYLDRTGKLPQDAVLDIAVTPNRPDATSHIGIARDVSALLETPVRVPGVVWDATSPDAGSQITIDVEVPQLCPRYVAMIIRGVDVGESPQWLQKRLRSVGLRPRNNVVDVTNFVMYECGQPLHAFDYDRIAGRTIRVRASEADERFMTLDSKERVLPQGTILICDASRPIAIGGIMGGENSEVSDATTNVLIESAYFDPASIRRSSRALGLQTDSSYRFERGVDAAGQPWAAARAARLIAELSGGQLVPGIADANPLPFEPREVELRLERVRSVLGVDVPREVVYRLLTAIGFHVVERGDGRFKCVVPSHRPDVEREIDVIEEVARLYGYENIPEPTQTTLPGVVPRERPVDLARSAARLALVGMGYREVVTNSMLRTDTAKRFVDPEVSWLRGDVVETLNPISLEMSALRPSLLPTILDVMRHNRNRGGQRLRFFEFGHVFRRVPEGGTFVPGYAEEESILIAAMGPRYEPGLYGGGERFDFFDLRGVVEELLARLRLQGVTLEPSAQVSSIASLFSVLNLEGAHVGVIGRLAENVAADYDLDSAVYFGELAWDRLVAASDIHVPSQYKRIARFPSVDRDLAFVVPRAQAVGEMLDAIEQQGGELLSQARVFDVYEGKGILDGRKSVAFSLRFAADRTLTDEEVDERIASIVRAVTERFEADLRA